MARYSEKNFNTEQSMRVNSIDDLLDQDEEVLWREKPKKAPFIMSKIFNMLPFALIWLVFDGCFIGLMIANNIFAQLPVGLLIFLILFFIFHLTPFWIWLSNVITATIAHKHIEYAITSRRIIVRSGVLVDIDNVYFVDISSVNLKVGLVDRWFKVGDIYITTKSRTFLLSDISNPYIVSNKLQKIINDIKSDTYFPNALRPKTNENFQTDNKVNAGHQADKNHKKIDS